MPGWVLEVEGPGGTILSLLAMVEVEGLLLGTRDGERHLSLSLTLTANPAQERLQAQKDQNGSHFEFELKY